ncbi:LptF/LptG family permease [bacterium]|nr:LptF/LptG family permease [bacterium]
MYDDERQEQGPQAETGNDGLQPAADTADPVQPDPGSPDGDSTSTPAHAVTEAMSAPAGNRIVTHYEVRRNTGDVMARRINLVAAEDIKRQEKLHGLQLTKFHDEKGKVQKLDSPLIREALKVVRDKKSRTFTGRNLTLHHDSKGRIHDIGMLLARGEHRHVGFWQAILAALKWLFVVRFKVLTIEKYLWLESFGFFMLGTMGFTFFLIITSIFALGEKIFSKGIPPFTIAKVLLLSAPAFIVLAIPVAVLFSTLMSMGRLNRDNEIVAFMTNGVSLYRIYIPFVTMAIVAGLMTWSIYEHVVPPTNREYKEVLKVFWTAQVVDFIKPGIIIKAPQKKYFYVDEIVKRRIDLEEGGFRDESFMLNIRLYDYFVNEGGTRRFPRIFVAREGYVRDKFLVLTDVTLYNLDETNGDSIVCAEMPEVRIDIGTRVIEYALEPQPTELNTKELRSRIARTRDRIAALAFPNPGLQSRYVKDWTEYYFKYSIPFACIALMLVAVPVSLRGPRDERNMGIILSFALMMIYYIIFFSARVLGSRGVIMSQDLVIAGHKLASKGDNIFHPMIAGWLAPMLFVGAAVVLIIKARK